MIILDRNPDTGRNLEVFRLFKGINSGELAPDEGKLAALLSRFEIRTADLPAGRRGAN